MKIRFGMGLNAGCWPEFSQGQQAVIGEVITGPQGFIGVLETALGLVPADEPEALRIRQYMRRIQALPAGSRFYTKSFDSDAWGTARELLQWRDELVMHGWDDRADTGRGQTQPRIAALAEIEKVTAETLSAGLADRFQTVLGKLKGKPSLPVSRILLQEPTGLLPSPWQDLLGRLEACGVMVEEAEQPQTEPQEIVMLESEHTWPLAQTVASWLNGFDQKTDVALLCQLDAGQLDQAMHGLGLPATGQISKSAQLSVYQLLPLLLENIWKPVRIDRLMELLSVPVSPVPGFAARFLVEAIAKAPGLEGTKWQEALENIRKRKCEYLIKDELAEDEAAVEAERFTKDLDQWLRLSRVDAAEEAPSSVVTAAIQRLVEYLAKISDSLPSARVAMGHCRDMLMVLEDMGSISKPLLERILDDVIGPGRSVGNLREAASWGVISNPSQLIAPVDTLIWWGFTDPSSPSADVWNRGELEWLAAQGVHIDRPQLVRSRERFYWQSLMKSCKRLILCKPEELDGQVVPVHPLWFEIEADTSLNVKPQHQHALQLLTIEAPELMGVKLQLEPVKMRASIDITAIKHAVAAPQFTPAKLSPSSIGTLFGCNFKWLLETLGIDASDMMSFPEEAAMIGTLAHQVLEDLLTLKEVPVKDSSVDSAEKRFAIPDPDDAIKLAGQRFDIRVPEMAADLLLPENAADYEGIRKRVMDAAGDVSRRFTNAGFVSVTCEEWIRTELNGIPVNGRADVIAYDKNNKAHIIDFKYSYGSNFYREKISKGRDVQLIIYSRMLGEQESPVAYYLVPKREMLTNSPVFAVDVVESKSGIGEGWGRVSQSVGSALSLIRKGEVVAQGLYSEEELKQREAECDQKGDIYLDPPCRFCDFAALCGLNAESDGE